VYHNRENSKSVKMGLNTPKLSYKCIYKAYKVHYEVHMYLMTYHINGQYEIKWGQNEIEIYHCGSLAVWGDPIAELLNYSLFLKIF